MKKLFLEILGCPKNYADAEKKYSNLIKAKKYIFTNHYKQADIIVIYLCCFINPALKESIQTINFYLKNKKPETKIIIEGCLLKKKFLNQFKDNSSIIINAGVKGKSKGEDAHNKLILPSSYPYAYVKISDGCNRKCKFCVIPKIKGRYKSRDLNDVLKEIKFLTRNNYKEIILIGQDTSNYLKDKGEINGLQKLIKHIIKIKKDYKLRIMYLYPNNIKDDLIKLMCNEEKIYPYFDIPLQHSEDKILKKMRRGYRKKDIYRLINKIRSVNNNAVLRSVMITGFDDETEKEFQALYNFCEEIEFDYCLSFPYYPYKKELQDASMEARERSEILYEINSFISINKRKKYINKIIKVLIEEKNKTLLYGRSYFDAPEIDGKIIIKGSGKTGGFQNTRILKSKNYDLYGKIIK